MGAYPEVGTISMWDRFKMWFDGWWRRNICDDFDRHYPNEPWLF